MEYNRSKLNQFIIKHFNDEELRILCAVEFRDVYDDFSDGWGKKRKVMELVGWCERNGQEVKLLTALQRERSRSFRIAFGKTTVKAETVEVPIKQATKSTKTPERKPKTTPATMGMRSREELAILIPNPPGIRIHPISGKEMIRIPAGDFLYGEKKENRYLPEFWIDKTPVTNADYAKFVTESGYKAPKHWHGLSPKHWRGLMSKTLTEPDKIANHPVVNVSWHDALAYAEWATCQLPTEEQWEKAARGVDGRIYPWGNNGCVDMSGNVWEWTASLRQESRDWRILRGGAFSFSSYLQDVRTTHRGFNDPAVRDYNLGFRVAVSS